jgi:uncharacterized protein (TIGR02466 family)
MHNKNEIYITNSWINVTTHNQQHASHKHNNSIISGVYYLDVPADSSVSFERANNPCLELIPESYNSYNSPSCDIPVSTGKLIMFPSELYHLVKPNLSTEMRISLAFNTFIRGSIGDRDITSYAEIK